MLDYRVDEVARAVGGELRGPGDARITRVSTDSRKLEPGDLFVAITGERFDGHDFVPGALEAASAALVNPARLPQGFSSEKPLICVDDPQTALGALGAYHRSRFPVRVVGITGSVGKTTTKDLCAAVLSAAFWVHKNPGNLNAEIGVPMTLLDLTCHHEIAVVEMAMRGREQIRYLARLARPEVGVITNIGLSHIELLGSQQAIAEAKAELLEELPAEGVAVLNADDSFFPFLRSKANAAITYGFSEGADVRGEMLEGDGLTESRFRFAAPRFGIGSTEAALGMAGKHNVVNALAAVSLGLHFGMTAEQIVLGLAGAQVSGMRMEVHRRADGVTILDDAYNASSPSAMLAALDVLARAPLTNGGRRIAVLGNMLELGDRSLPAHREVGEQLPRFHADALLTVGDHAAALAEAARAAGMNAAAIESFTDNEAALEKLRNELHSGDVVLIKGSRGMRMETIVRGLLDDAA